MYTAWLRALRLCVPWLAVAILRTLLEERVHVQQGSYEAILGSHQLASTDAVRATLATNALVVE